MDMSKPVVISLKTWADWYLEDSLLESCRVALKAVFMVFLLATLTVGPDVVWATWEQFGKALEWR